jgi:DNA-binding XRE family transcriptional regulator
MPEVRRKVRKRKLSLAEAEKYRKLREAVDAEIPVVRLEHRQREKLLGVLEQLKLKRQNAGLSLADISSRTGMSRSAISNLENGKRKNPTFETVLRYADAVGFGLEVRPVKIEKLASEG